MNHFRFTLSNLKSENGKEKVGNSYARIRVNYKTAALLCFALQIVSFNRKTTIFYQFLVFISTNKCIHFSIFKRNINRWRQNIQWSRTTVDAKENGICFFFCLNAKRLLVHVSTRHLADRSSIQKKKKKKQRRKNQKKRKKKVKHVRVSCQIIWYGLCLMLLFDILFSSQRGVVMCVSTHPGIILIQYIQFDIHSL